MKVFHTVDDARGFSLSERKAGRSVVFVPTMGALHEGHLSLMRRGKELGDTLVVSIFLNPTQFAPNEDLDKYPKTFEADLDACRGEGVAAVFAPSPSEMYPRGKDEQLSWVSVEKLSGGLCGASRPGHFKGVATVVAKLFNIVLPDVAVFGEKDFQQAVIIKRMVEDLNFPVRIETAPIVREPDGLAMSSRNALLTPKNRKAATAIFRSLREAARRVADGERDAAKLTMMVEEAIGASGGTVDYVRVVDTGTLSPLDVVEGEALLAVAAKYGDVRLIDNILLGAAG